MAHINHTISNGYLKKIAISNPQRILNQNSILEKTKQ